MPTAVMTSELLSGVQLWFPLMSRPFLEDNIEFSMRMDCNLTHKSYLQCDVIFQTYSGVQHGGILILIHNITPMSWYFSQKATKK
jgi:hypothetical protein